MNRTLALGMTPLHMNILASRTLALGAALLCSVGVPR